MLHIVWQLLTIAITPAGAFTKIVHRTFFYRSALSFSAWSFILS
jgi:hypothetical protein